MAQINLLKNNTSSSGSFRAVNAILVKLGVLVVLGVLGYYGYVFFQSSQTGKSVAVLEQEVAAERSQLSTLKGLDELSTRQGQLKELSGLIDKHYYWSTFFPVLASSTLSSSTYTSIRSLADNTIALSLVVPSIQDLDRYLQVFNRKEINNYFRNVRIGAINRSFQDDSLITKIDVRFEFNPELLKYNNQYAHSSSTPVSPIPVNTINPGSPSNPRSTPR